MPTFKSVLAVLFILIIQLLHLGSTSTITEATAFCAEVGRVGRYAHAEPEKYYYCYLYGGQILGQIYTCPGSTLFDDAKGMCV